MSILNILLQGDKAYVAVDTFCVHFATGHVFEGNKMIPMPGLGVVIAGQGTPDLMYQFAMSMASFLRKMDFDEIRSEAAGIDAWFQRVDASYAAAGAPESSPARSGQRLVVVGWSRQDGCMAGLSFHRPLGADSFTVEPIESGLCSPAYNDDLTELVVPTATDYMRAVAAAQMRTNRETPDQPVLGGRLMVAEVSKDRIVIGDAGVLPDSPAGV